MNPPLAVIRYLAELDAALAARNAPDRDQIVTQIGEHISQALGDAPDPSEAEIASVLAELGDPLRIAEEAAPSMGDPTFDRPTGAASAPPRPCSSDQSAPSTPLLRRPWVPALVVALWVVGVMWPLLSLSWQRVSGGDMLRESVLIFARDIPLIASIVLVLCSPLYRTIGRILWTLLSPLFLVATLMLTLVSLYYRGVPWLFTTICAAVVVAGVATVVMITRRARHRAAVHRPPHAGALEPITLAESAGG